MPLEAEIFKLTEWEIQIWLRVMQELHQVGGWGVLGGVVRLGSETLPVLLRTYTTFRLQADQVEGIYFEQVSAFSGKPALH